MEMVRFAKSAHDQEFQVTIAGADGAAHLPGMFASLTPLPVIGVPVESQLLKGLDSQFSIVQMPGGVPVATMAINGGRNAGLLDVRVFACGDPKLLKKITEFQTRLASESKSKNRKLQSATKSYLQA